jgi:hypothetical protein
MPLSFAIGVGADHYVACAITSVPLTAQDERPDPSNPLTAWSALFATDDPLPEGGVVVSVPAGAPAITATLRDSAGNVPVGVTVTITRPDGTVIDAPSEPTDPSIAVTILNGSLVTLLDLNPQPGDWRINIESSYSGQLDYGFYFSTLPSANGPAVMASTLSKMADGEIAAKLSKLAGLESTECFWCKIGCYALGVVIAALAAIGITIVTAGTAAPVAIASLGTFLGVSTMIAGGLVAGAITAVASSAAIAASYICSWANVCPAPSSLTAQATAPS